MWPASVSVAPMAFSQAMTATGAASSGRRSMPRAMTGRHELEDAGADRARHHVGRGDLARHLVLVGPRVDGAVVGDGLLDRAVGAELHHLVRLGLVELVDQRRGHVGEHHLVARRVQEAGHEAAADVAGAKVHGLLGPDAVGWCGHAGRGVVGVRERERARGDGSRAKIYFGICSF